ncbi:MAG: hypothetical protein ACLU7B_06760 [Bifidobacterium adolescentis]
MAGLVVRYHQQASRKDALETKDDVDDFLDAYRRELIAAIENGKKIPAMNTSKSQAFATDARRQLMNAVRPGLTPHWCRILTPRLTTRVRSLFCSVRSSVVPVAA